MQDPLLPVAKGNGNELGQHGGNGFVQVAAGPAVAGQDVEIVFRNADPLGKLPFGDILFGNDFVEPVPQASCASASLFQLFHQRGKTEHLFS